MPFLEEFSTKKETIQRNIESFFRPIFSLLASQGLRLKIERNPQIPTAAFSHEKEEIVINPDFYEEFCQKLPEDEEYTFLYTLAHELSYYLQLIEDPKEYLRSFGLAEKWAKEKGEESNFEARRQIWTKLFNVILDLNNKEKIEGYFIPFQEQGSKGYLPKKIYKNVLFPKTDFSADPLTAQFFNALLREGILKEEKTEVSPEIRGALEKKVYFLGEEISLQNLVYKHLAPKETGLGTINFVVEKYLKPVFEELLDKDEKDGRLPQVIEIIIKGLGDFPRPQDKEGQEAKKALAENVLKKNRTSKERGKDLADKLFEGWAQGAVFSQEEKERLKEIIENSEKYSEDLKQIWYQTIRISKEEELEKRAAFKMGTGIEPTRIAAQFPTILESPQEAEIFYRYLTEVKERILPKSIKTILILDMSGSMLEGEKIRKVQEAAYPFLRSLNLFQDELALNSPDGISPIKVESKIIGFGSYTLLLPEKPQQDPQAKIAQAIIEFQRKTLGNSTEDDKALELAEQEFSQEDFERIKRGELLAFVLEITDGVTHTEHASRELVRRMNKKGILTKAIQIPSFGDSPLEKITEKPLTREEEEELRKELEGTFERVWGEHGQRLQSLDQLKDIFLLLLAKALIKGK